MKLAVVAALGMSGCKGILGLDPGVVIDGGLPVDTDAPLDANEVPVDARACFGAYNEICLMQPPPDEYQVTSSTLFDTTLGAAACTEVQLIDGVDVCIKAARHITVNAGATLQTGGLRFLVLVATEDITVAGTLDGWNAGSTTCTTQQGGAQAGGAGGTFGTLGGTGSLLGTNPRPVPSTITTFRRGCPGDEGGSDSQGGDGGGGGSGIFLVAPRIHLTSTARINASGFGGGGGNNDRGGGGGGSGGLILFDSEVLQIDSGAIAIAVGGGGGGGGGAGTAMQGSRATTSLPITAGQGGPGNAGASGAGGDGGTTGSGQAGGLGSNGRGSGGGGGGTGVIFATAPPSAIANNGTVSPTMRAP